MDVNDLLFIAVHQKKILMYEVFVQLHESDITVQKVFSV